MKICLQLVATLHLILESCLLILEKCYVAVDGICNVRHGNRYDANNLSCDASPKSLPRSVER